VWRQRKVVRHDRRCSTKEAEGRRSHALIFQREQGRDASLHRLIQQFQRIASSELRVPRGELFASDGLAVFAATGASLVGRFGRNVGGDHNG